ncbi:MAG: DUF3820 family protein [Parachlamydiales bacterium]|jgi:DNA polymerase-3 subunit epsilon
MRTLAKEIFICLDCETTGLEASTDRIIEIAAVKFTFEKELGRFETLVDPETPIPPSSQEIHHISDEMVKNKPKIAAVLPDFFKFLDRHPIIGHSIQFDLNILNQEALRARLSSPLENPVSIDTLRLARLYGESPINSLQMLREHFHIEPEGAHRAMSDVTVNIAVFKKLSQKFKTLKELLERLQKPILMQCMPLGKHKGRKFKEIPTDYLEWAIRKDFDLDLIFSIRTELKKRSANKNFHQASNPFGEL